MNLESEDKNYIVISGNNIDSLKNYPDNYFDSVVTDPPYGLGKEPNAEEMLRAWIDTGYLAVGGSGFMGKEWDAFVPQPLFWKEIFRVLKYGGHIVAFFGTRTYDWGCMAIRLAGFEIRDCIQWVYGSGFPKSHNVGKAIDTLQGNKRKIVGEGKSGKTAKAFNLSDEQRLAGTGNISGEYEISKGNSEWEGWGSALKPANEPIVLARKPLQKGLSIAENVLKWGTGAINIDGCRVGNEKRTIPVFSDDKKTDETSFNLNSNIQHHREETSQGRFPANFIMTHHPDCKCIGIKKVGSGKLGGYNYEGNVYDVDGFVPNNSPVANSNYGEEIVEDWNCHEDCPIKIMDEQSGISKSSDAKRNRNTIGSFGMPNDNTNEYNDKGGASRFFYIAKASKWERNFGLDDFEDKRFSAYGYDVGLGEKAEGMFKDRNPIKKNIHPTVKPIKLMQYLVRMITPPNGIVLDPFAGSGTTGIACKIDGFNFVGLELSEEYTEIAKQRIDSFVEENVFIDETIIYKLRDKDEDDNNESNQLSLF